MVAGTAESETGHYPVCFSVHLVLDRNRKVGETVSYDLDQLSHGGGTTRLLEIAETTIAIVVESPFGGGKTIRYIRVSSADNLVPETLNDAFGGVFRRHLAPPLGLITSVGWYSHIHETTPLMKSLQTLCSTTVPLLSEHPSVILPSAPDQPEPD
jgi:hypothetical protein